MPFRNPIIDQLVVGDGNGPHIFIGNPIPAELTAYYTGSGFDDITPGWMGFYITDADYFYIIAAGGSVNGDRIMAIGVVIAGVVNEIIKPRWFHSAGESALQSFPGIMELDAASGNFGGILLGTNSTPRILIGDGGSQEIFFGGVAAGLGILAGVRITTVGALVSGIGATETNIPNYHISANVEAGRMYRFGLQPGLLSPTVATDLFQIVIRRDTPVTGNTVAIWTISGGTNSETYEQYVTFGSSGFVDFYLSLVRQAGTGTITISGSPGGTVQSRGYFYVEDVSDSPGAWTTA